MVKESNHKHKKSNWPFTLYLWLIGTIIALPVLTATLNSYVHNEYFERTRYLQVYDDVSPPIVNMSVVKSVVAVVITLCVLACMVISFRYPPGAKNNKAFIWLSSLSVSFGALMIIDFIDESTHSYHINSFSDKTNGFMLDNLAVVLYNFLIPTMVVLGLIFVTSNLVLKIQFAQKKK